MEFLLFRLEGNRVKDGVVLTADWNEKVVRDFVAEDLRQPSSHLRDTRTCVCPAGHVPPAVSERHVKYCRKHSVPSSKISVLAEWQSKITDRNREAFADPLGYVGDYPAYGLLFLREALAGERKKAKSLTGQIKQIRDSGMPPEPMCPESMADERTPEEITASAIKSLESQKESVSQLVKGIQAEMKRLAAEPGGETEIPAEFWDYVNVSAADAGKSGVTAEVKCDTGVQKTVYAEDDEKPAKKSTRKKASKAKRTFSITDIQQKITVDYPIPGHATKDWLAAADAKTATKAGVGAVSLTTYRSRAVASETNPVPRVSVEGKGTQGTLGCDNDGRVFFKHSSGLIFYLAATIKPDSNAFKKFYR